MIGRAIGCTHKFTYVNSKRVGEFAVRVVSEDFGQQAVNCEESRKSGDEVWEKYGLHAEKSRKVDVPRIREAVRAVLECRVDQFIELDGDHIILVGKVLHAGSEEEDSVIFKRLS